MGFRHVALPNWMGILDARVDITLLRIHLNVGYSTAFAKDCVGNHIKHSTREVACMLRGNIVRVGGHLWLANTQNQDKWKIWMARIIKDLNIQN